MREAVSRRAPPRTRLKRLRPTRDPQSWALIPHVVSSGVWNGACIGGRRLPVVASRHKIDNSSQWRSPLPPGMASCILPIDSPLYSVAVSSGARNGACIGGRCLPAVASCQESDNPFQWCPPLPPGTASSILPIDSPLYSVARVDINF
jgi:hypothetical protein